MEKGCGGWAVAVWQGVNKNQNSPIQSRGGGGEKKPTVISNLSTKSKLEGENLVQNNITSQHQKTGLLGHCLAVFYGWFLFSSTNHWPQQSKGVQQLNHLSTKKNLCVCVLCVCVCGCVCAHTFCETVGALGNLFSFSVF